MLYKVFSFPLFNLFSHDYFYFIFNCLVTLVDAAAGLWDHLGLSKEEVFRVHIAAILHDVGKLGIRESILNKPGGLSDDEFEIMRQHPSIGAQIMSPIRMLKDIIPGIRNHHETWDGKGYPDGLEGEEIPFLARILSVADVYDSMASGRT